LKELAGLLEAIRQATVRRGRLAVTHAPAGTAQHSGLRRSLAVSAGPRTTSIFDPLSEGDDLAN